MATGQAWPIGGGVSTNSRDDAVTVAALGMLAASLTTVAHEAIGHGGACLSSGGRIALLTNVYFECAPRASWIAAFGPLGNLSWAFLAWLALRATPAQAAATRLVLVLTMTLSMFWEAGYMLYAAVLNEGDYIIAARGQFGAVGWPLRVGLFIAGLALYLFARRLASSEAAPFASAPGRVQRTFRIAWLAAALSAAVAALLYAPDRIGSLRQGALEIGAAALPMLFPAPIPSSALKRPRSASAWVGRWPPVRCTPRFWQRSASACAKWRCRASSPITAAGRAASG